MSARESICAPRGGLYRRLFARYYDRMMSGYEEYVAPRKQELLGNLDGTVVEIGAGTGSNLPFLPRGCRWVGVEPNPHMHKLLKQKAAELEIDAEIQLGDSAKVPLADGEADHVVITLVLCSVPDVGKALAEVTRVLKPGGTFVFIEHVVAKPGTRQRTVQNLVAPVWRVCGDGCRVNRDTAAAIRSADFKSVEIEEFEMPSPPNPSWVSPHIIGTAMR